MSSRHDPGVTVPWMRQGTAVLLEALGRLPDAAFAEPSALPDWSRAHVAGHVARNAEALIRLATWARTGVESPMYASPEQRVKDIESSATLLAGALREDVAVTAGALQHELDRLDDTMWRAPVRSAMGREVPAAEIPWMRVREVWLHAVDLDAGVGIAELPAGVVDTLLDDATGVISGRDGCPAVRLEPVDRERSWDLGADGVRVAVTGAAADVLGWLVGRSAGSGLRCRDGSLPAVPRWL